MNMGQQNIWQRFIVKRLGFDIWRSINIQLLKEGSLSKTVLKCSSIQLPIHVAIDNVKQLDYFDTLMLNILRLYSVFIYLYKPTFQLE